MEARWAPGAVAPVGPKPGVGVETFGLRIAGGVGVWTDFGSSTSSMESKSNGEVSGLPSPFGGGNRGRGSFRGGVGDGLSDSGESLTRVSG